MMLLAPISPVFEAHVSSQPKHAQNKLDYEMAIDLRLSPNDTGKMIKGWELLLTPEYQTDRHDLIRIAKGDILHDVYCAVSWNRGSRQIIPHVDFYWRPFLGVELNHDIKSEHVLDDDFAPSNSTDEKLWVVQRAYISRDAILRHVLCHGRLHLWAEDIRWCRHAWISGIEWQRIFGSS